MRSRVRSYIRVPIRTNTTAASTVAVIPTPTCHHGTAPWAIRPGITIVEAIGSIETTVCTLSLPTIETK